MWCKYTHFRAIDQIFSPLLLKFKFIRTFSAPLYTIVLK